MLVRFVSSETGEILMFAEVAGRLLRGIGKDTTARGAFTRDEMAWAATQLRQAVSTATPPAQPSSEEDEAAPPLVGLAQRAWPLIDMLERTARGGSRANIVWEASADF